MNRRILLVFSFFIAFATQAQLKKITLEDGVLQQGRKFGADRMTGFQWIPDTNKYVYYKDSWTTMVMGGQGPIATETPTLADINKALGTQLKNFFGAQWLDAHTILVAEGSKYYTYSVASKTGKKVQEVAENAENQTLDKAKQNLAFTEGNNLYFSDKNNKKVTVTNNSDKNIVSGQTISRNEFGISGGIFWSPKSSYLAFYQKDESNVADYPLLDINETPGKLVSIKYPMIGQKSEKPRVGIYSLATGKTVFIAPKYNDPEGYLTNLSWTPDEKYILIAELNRAQNDMHLNVYEAETGNFVRTILNETNPNWVEPEHDAYFPNAASNNFIWFSEKDGFHNLYYYSIDGKLIRQLTANKFPAREIVGSNPAGTEIYFKATGENGTNMLVYKVDLKGKQTLITKDMGVHNVAISTDGNWIFDEYSNHTTPSKSVLYDKKGKAVTLLESKNKYDGYEMGTAEIKTIKAADGTTDLYTRLIKPSNFDPSKKYPVLVYVYGGPHAQMITNSYLDGANLWMYWMAEQGYLVFTVDNRGSDNRGFAFESVIHGRVGVNEIEDQIKGVDYLKSLPYVDGNRLAVHGWSFGGFMTTSLMLRKPDTFKVGVAGGPVTDWKYYEVMYGERYMDTPSENQKGFDEASTLNYVKDLKGKLLLIHGTSDDVVVMQQNFALIKKFVEAQKQIDFFAYPMHKHNVLGKDREHLMTKVLNYIIDNNK